MLYLTDTSGPLGPGLGLPSTDRLGGRERAVKGAVRVRAPLSYLTRICQDDCTARGEGAPPLDFQDAVAEDVYHLCVSPACDPLLIWPVQVDVSVQPEARVVAVY